MAGTQHILIELSLEIYPTASIVYSFFHSGVYIPHWLTHHLQYFSILSQ